VPMGGTIWLADRNPWTIISGGMESSVSCA
jgi:hypothetical protein